MTPDEDFYVGWRGAIGRRLPRFLRALGIVLPALALSLALVLGAAADDPAGPAFAATPPVAEGEAAFEGALTLAPYPLLHLADGRTLLLAEDGKRGAAVDPALAGRRVAARGYVLARGAIAMLVLAAPPEPRGEAPPPAVEPLGRWRIAGEICDGKCAAGGMRPGTGLAHRACATLCLDGALPAVFVATAPVAGSEFLLLGAADGGAMPTALRDRIGLRTTLDGTLERRGGMLVFLADAAR